MLYLIGIVVIAFLLWFFILRKFKVPKLAAISMFTGGVKTGKSAVSLYFAIKTYKRCRRAWRFRCFIAKFFRKEKPEEPLFYSNIPLRYIKYCPLTKEHLLRKVRFNFGSVVFIDEAALVADSRLAIHKDLKINNDLLLFFKLFGHETHGGTMIINSQAITDMHVSLRRCCCSYFYIHHLGSLPFIRIPCLREERFSEDGAVLNSYDNDVEDSLKKVLMSSRIFKKYDCYCYSFFTDDLPVNNIEMFNGKNDSLKAEKIISFNPVFADLSKKEEVIFNA